MTQRKATAAAARSRKSSKRGAGLAEVVDISSRRVLTASDLTKVRKVDLLSIEVPEFAVGDEPAPLVYYKRLTAGAVLDFVADNANEDTKRDAMLVLVSQQVCDQQGKPLFPNIEDAAALRELRIDVFNRISQALMEGLGKETEAGKG